MRPPHALAGMIVIALTFGAFPAEACHGEVMVIGENDDGLVEELLGPCGSDCTTYYFVSSPAGAGMVLALYQEANGVAGLQRGGAPTLQGGYDDCWQGPHFDERVL